jgi:hypothetical protein
MAEPTPPGEELTPFSESLIKDKLESYSESPIIGLEYILELQPGTACEP